MCDPITIGLAIGGASALSANVNANKASNARDDAARAAKKSAAKTKRASDLKLRSERSDRYASESRGGDGVEYGSSFSGGGMFSPRSFFRG